jgi:hypothetical protein
VGTPSPRASGRGGSPRTSKASARTLLQDPRQRGAAHRLRPAGGGGALPWRVVGHQRGGCGAHGARHGAGAYHRDDPVRLRHAVSVQALQPRIPCRKGPARPAWMTGTGTRPAASLRGMIRVLLSLLLAIFLLFGAERAAAQATQPRCGCGGSSSITTPGSPRPTRIENLPEAGTASTSFFENLRATLVDWRARFRTASPRTPLASPRWRPRSRRLAPCRRMARPSPTPSPNGARPLTGWRRRASRRSTPPPPSPAPTG